MTTSKILLARNLGRVCHLELNRPDKRNAPVQGPRRAGSTHPTALASHTVAPQRCWARTPQHLALDLDAGRYRSGQAQPSRLMVRCGSQLARCTTRPIPGILEWSR
jgi:hypothetical protein